MFSRRWQVVALVICVLMFQPYPTVLKAAASAPIPSIPVSLAVAVSMKVLPADGAIYPAVIVYLHDRSGAPTVAIKDTPVYLVSSAEAVGQVIPAVTIGTGQSFAVANFTTTRSPGKTQVTATATGLESGTVAVTTGTATGYPDVLKIAAVPNVVPAKLHNQGSLIVELLDDSGLPAKAVRDTNVTLYSSNSNITKLPQNSVIKAGQFIILVNYTTELVPGSATITASASGFQPASTTVTVLGQAPLALKLYALPSNMNTCPLGGLAQSCEGRLVVALLDLGGNPVRAPRNITVFIRSSNLNVVNLPSFNYSVKILTGSISVPASYTSTPRSGNATITASSPNLDSAFVTVQTFSVVKPPQALQLYIGPSTVLADDSSYRSVVVALTVPGNPAVPAVNDTSTLVTLTSSVAATGNITKTFLRIPAGQSYVEWDINSTYQVGTTKITASAQNLRSAQGQLSTYGAIPSKIVVQALSPQLPADGLSHLGLEVMLEDSFGQPAIADKDISVNLTSSHNDIVSVTSFATLRAGHSFAIVNATTGVLSGEANVTAVAPLRAGPSFSSTLIDTVIPSPSALVATVNAGSAFLTSVYGPTMVVQLQDAKGNPARARQTTNVTITSSNSTVIGKTLVLPIGPGEDYGTLSLPVKSLGTTTLTVFSKGLTPASVALTIGPYPLQAQLTASTTTIPGNGSALLTALMLLDGVPMAGLPVSWNVTSGLLKTLNSTTGKAGTAQAYFQPQRPGSSTVTAAVSNSPYGSAKSSVTVYVLPVVVPVKPGLLETLLTFPLVLAPVGAAVAGVVAILFLLRRRRKVEEITDEGYESSSG